MSISWTKEEITEFNRLYQLPGGNQMDRINSHIGMPIFIARHGNDKCQAMNEHIMSSGKLEASK